MGTLGTPMMGTDPSTWKWQQIAEFGKFNGHPSGPFELNAIVFSEIVRNFKADGIPVMWDFEHASEQEPTAGTVPVAGTPAQGWVHDLDNRGPGGLWALVEWGPLAKEYIQSGKYRWCSPAVRFGCKDRHTGNPIGARLTSVALTGNPFLKSMQPITAKDQEGTSVRLPVYALMKDTAEASASLVVAMGATGLERTLRQPHEYMPQLKAALKMGPLSSAVDCSDELAKLRSCCEMADVSGYHEGTNLHDYMHPLADIVGMTGPQHQWGDILDTVEDMIDAAMDRHIDADHGGQTSMTDSPTSLEEAHLMSDTNAVALLKDAQDKAVTLTAKVSGLETEVGTLKTNLATLKDVEGRAVAAEATVKGITGLVTLKDGETLDKAIARIVEENKTLLSEKATRAEADLQADVDAAFATYKDKRGLTDKSKKSMLVLAKADMAQFREEYPPIPEEQRYLMRTLTPAATRDPADKDDLATITFTELTRRLMADKKLSYADAQTEAQRLLEDHAKKAA